MHFQMLFAGGRSHRRMFDHCNRHSDVESQLRIINLTHWCALCKCRTLITLGVIVLAGIMFLWLVPKVQEKPR
jgi:hypothetical protein